VVGIATAGKDTGGANFFVNLAPNLHLDGHYTTFAEVIDGMKVVDRLEIGDKILSVDVNPRN
jgi:cyclophilin family peptidyl-prolyl cis-trans isomerase